MIELERKNTKFSPAAGSMHIDLDSKQMITLEEMQIISEVIMKYFPKSLKVRGIEFRNFHELNELMNEE